MKLPVFEIEFLWIVEEDVFTWNIYAFLIDWTCRCYLVFSHSHLVCNSICYVVRVLATQGIYSWFTV